MRRKLALVSLSLCFTLLLYSQEIRQIDWQDFAASITRTNIADPVKTGEFAIFRIVNINKFLYKVEISGKVFDNLKNNT